VALAYYNRRGSIECGDEDLLPRPFGEVRSVGQILHVRKFGVTPAHEGKPAAVAREFQIIDFQPIIFVKFGQFPSGRAPVGDPDVTQARRIFDPGEARSVMRARQPAGDGQR